MLERMIQQRFFFEKNRSNQIFQGDLSSLCQELIWGLRMIEERLPSALSSKKPPICVYDEDWKALSEMFADQFKSVMSMDVSEEFFMRIIKGFIQTLD